MQELYFTIKSIESIAGWIILGIPVLLVILFFIWPSNK